MEERLNRAGIFTVAELWQAAPFQLRRVCGGIHELLFHQMLQGVDIQPPSSRFAKSIGRQHVLEPELRTSQGAGNFARVWDRMSEAVETSRLPQSRGASG
jgi:hypothetical protein